MKAPSKEFWVKVKNCETVDLNKSLNGWASADKVLFKIYEDRIEFSDHVIMFSDVERASLSRAPYLNVTHPILSLDTPNRTYEFAFRVGTTPEKYLNLPIVGEPFSGEYFGFRIFFVAFALILLLSLVFTWVFGD